ncbi:MAG: hypothetical protein R3C11_04225 [Planctomycetaceae bacterium]
MSTEPAKKKRWSWKRKIFFVMLFLFGCFCARTAWYAATQEPLKPSKETTYFTGPLREDGTVDYDAALNEINKQGVTPENNSVVLLVEAIGPGVSPHNKFYEELGIERPSEKGDYFLDFATYEAMLMDKLPVPIDEAAFDAYSQIDYSKDYKDAQNLPWSETEYPEVARWLELNKLPLDKILAAGKRTDYYNPRISEEVTNLDQMYLSLNLSHISSNLRPFINALSARCMYLIHAGDFDSAISHLKSIHQLSQFYTRESGFIPQLQFSATTTHLLPLINQLINSGQNSKRSCNFMKT